METCSESLSRFSGKGINLSCFLLSDENLYTGNQKLSQASQSFTDSKVVLSSHCATAPEIIYSYAVLPENVVPMSCFHAGAIAQQSVILLRSKLKGVETRSFCDMVAPLSIRNCVE